MGFIAVAIVAAIAISTGEGGFRFWPFARFVAVGVPLNFILKLAGGWVLMKVIATRHGSNVEQFTRMWGEVPPDIAAKVAGDPVFNFSKFLLWIAKWFLVIRAGMAVA